MLPIIIQYLVPSINPFSMTASEAALTRGGILNP
jgi:hypothetical protein